MGFRIPQYEQRTTIGRGEATPDITPVTSNTGIGQAITTAAGHIGNAFQKVQAEQAETESLQASSELRRRFETNFLEQQTQAQPGAPNFTPNFMSQVDEQVNKKAETLSSEASRKRLRDRMITYTDELNRRAMAWEVGQRISKRVEDFKTATDDNASTLFSVNGVARNATYDELKMELTETLNNVDLPPDAKARLKAEAETKMSYAAVRGDLRDRPEQIQGWLTGGAGDAYYARLKSVESGGRNLQSKTSSAFGPYQFTKGTWSDLIKRHPELELTEADRFQPAKQELAIRAFTKDNADVLKRNNIPLNDVNLYMTHFLGSGGAVKFIKEFNKNPNALAKDHVTSAAVKANPTIFRSERTVAAVMRLFGNKFGQKTTWSEKSNAPTYYRDLTFAHRNSLYSQANSEIGKRRSQQSALFKQSVQDSIAEFAVTGSSTVSPSEGQFMDNYGPERGAVAYGEYIVQSSAAKASYELNRMPIDEMGPYIENMKPKAGEEFYAEKLQAYQKTQAIGAQIQQQMKEDFGAFVTSRNEVAQELLTKAFDPQADANEAAAAADQYAQVMQAEAERYNMPGRTSLLPRAHVQSISATMNQQLTSDGHAHAKVQALNMYAERWGDRWPDIYREMKDDLSATVRVITSGIKEQAAVALATVHDQSFTQLAKTTFEKGDATAIESDLREAFEPFIVSTRWQTASIEGATLFYEQAKKLAAVYVSQGTDVSEAAQKAFDDLLGFKYDFIDSQAVNLRVPKTIGTDGVEYLLTTERERFLNKIDASPDELKIDTEASERLRRRLRRDSKWVTLPDNKGIGLLYNGLLRRDSAGKPIYMSWEAISARLPDAIKERHAKRFDDLEVTLP